MSWSVHTGPTPAAECAAAIDALDLGTGYGHDFPRDEAQAQLDAAKAAAKAILASGTVGIEGEYAITLNGHAEPGHERRPGYSADFINIGIQRHADYSAG